jgi:fatty acid-binding protein DegV
VVPVGQARSHAKAFTRLTELLKNLGVIENLALAVSDFELLEKFKAAIIPAYAGHIEEFMLGAALGTYAGPHAGGVFAIRRGTDAIHVPS